MRMRGRISRIAALGAAVLAVAAAGLLGAGPASADADIAVASITVGIGASGIQPIAIPAGSALIGQDTALIVLPDPRLAGTGFTARVGAGSTRGDCAADAGDGGYTCAAPGGGWVAGDLDLDFTAGGAAARVPDCGASCSFTTLVYEGSADGSPVAAGTVTAAAEAKLSIVVSGAAGGRLSVVVGNAGPTETADLTVSLTGLGGYTVSSEDSDCGPHGAVYVCDAGDDTGAVDTTDSWSMTLTGSTGQIRMQASVHATVFPAASPPHSAARRRPG